MKKASVPMTEIRRKVREDCLRARLRRQLSIECARKALLRVEKESGREGALVAIRDWLNAPHYGPVK